jgi:hypothetical protein
MEFFADLLGEPELRDGELMDLVVKKEGHFAA